MTSLIMSLLHVSRVLAYVAVVVLYYDQFGNQGKVKQTKVAPSTLTSNLSGAWLRSSPSSALQVIPIERLVPS